MSKAVAKTNIPAETNWEELKAHIRAGEDLIEGNLEHEAILFARWLHTKRMSDNLAAGTDPSPPLDPVTGLPATQLHPVTSAPVPGSGKAAPAPLTGQARTAG
jgi:hypothetical protein